MKLIVLYNVMANYNDSYIQDEELEMTLRSDQISFMYRDVPSALQRLKDPEDREISVHQVTILYIHQLL